MSNRATSFALLDGVNRVQMRVYRGPDQGAETQWGYFVRQPSFDK